MHSHRHRYKYTTHLQRPERESEREMNTGTQCTLAFTPSSVYLPNAIYVAFRANGPDLSRLKIINWLLNTQSNNGSIHGFVYNKLFVACQFSLRMKQNWKMLYSWVLSIGYNDQLTTIWRGFQIDSSFFSIVRTHLVTWRVQQILNNRFSCNISHFDGIIYINL